MSDPAVDVRVAELVLDGFADASAEIAVRAELARRLAGVTHGTPPEAVGAAVESAVADALRVAR